MMSGDLLERGIGYYLQVNEAGDAVEGSENLSAVPARLRRAKTALSIAATLAMVDGPLPFGDAVATGVLVTYATYEVATALSDSIRYLID